MLTHKKLLEEFIHFEKDNDLYEWEIENIPIWELIRIQVFNDLKSKNSNKTLNVYKKNKHRSIMLFFRFLKNSICYNPFKVFKHKTYLIFNHPRRKYNAGVFEDIYIDPFLPYLSKDKYIVLEGFLNSNIDHYRPVKTENLYYLDIIQLPSRILSNFPTNINLSALDKNKIHEIENAINQNWNTQIFNLEKKVVKYIKRWKFVYPKFIKLIKRTRPKKIILVISYSFLNQIIVYSAKQLRIPVIELQHGIVGKFHIAYNYMNSEKLNIKTFPSHFFAWGKKLDKRHSHANSKENIKIVGFHTLMHIVQSKK